MEGVAVEIKIPGVAAGGSGGKLHVRDETSVVEIPRKILLAERNRFAEYARGRNIGHGTEHYRLGAHAAGVFHEFAKTRFARDAPQIVVAFDRVGVAETEIDGLFKLVERRLGIFEIGERTGEIVMPGRIVRQKRHALAAGVLHRYRIALLERDHELAAQLFVRRLAGGIIPDRKRGDYGEQYVHINPRSASIWAV